MISSGPFRGQTSPGDDTVDMGMVHEVLTPGMEDGDEPYRGPEMFGVLEVPVSVSEAERKRRSYRTF